MIRSALFATVFAAALTLSAAAQEPHASTSTTPDTPVSVTANKDIQQQTGNGTATNTHDDQKSLEHQEKSAKAQAKNNKEEAKAAKAQRKALAAQDKANKEAVKTK